MLRIMAGAGTDAGPATASAATRAVDLRRDRTATRWLVATVVLVASGVASYGGTVFIAERFPDRPRPGDLLFEVLPHLDLARYATDIAVFTALAMLLAYALRHERVGAPGMMAAFALFYLLRAAVIVLTPLAIAHGDGEYFSFIRMAQNGGLSGHAGAALLCYLLVDPRRSPRLRHVQLGLVVAECLALVLSRSHYSADVIAGMLLAYLVWREWTVGTVLAPLKRWFVA